MSLGSQTFSGSKIPSLSVPGIAHGCEHGDPDIASHEYVHHLTGGLCPRTMLKGCHVQQPFGLGPPVILRVGH